MITLRYTPILTDENPYPPSEVFAPVSKRYYQVINGTVTMLEHDAMIAMFSEPYAYTPVNFPAYTPFTKEKYDAWKAKNKELLFASWFFQVSGFGYQAQRYVKGLNKLCNLYVLDRYDRKRSMFDWPEDLKPIMQKMIGYAPLVTLVDLTPSLPANTFIGQFRGIYTMFETDHIDDYNVDIINSYDFIIVPSESSRECFINSGVTKPIYKVWHGVAEEDWPYTPRQKTDTFTFGIYGQLSPRKGADIAVKAFMKAFPIDKYPKVKLFIKTSYNMGFWDESDPRIMVSHEVLSRKSLLELVNLWNCLVFPTRGEGFGLPPIEAMANGLPVIATDFSGIKEFLTDETGYPIRKVNLVKSWGYERRLADGTITPLNQNYGNFGEADIDETARLMKHVYENYEEATKKAEYAAKYVRENFQWDKMAEEMLNCIDKFLLSQLPENERSNTRNTSRESTKVHSISHKVPTPSKVSRTGKNKKNNKQVN